MHVIHRRLVCRIAFLTMCVLPTLLVIGRIVAHHLPTYRASVQRRLADQLGVGVSLDDVMEPRPGIVQLTNLRLYDLESDVTFATVGEAKVFRQWDRTVVELRQATLDGGHLKRLCRLLHDGTLCTPHDATLSIRLYSVGDVILRHEAAELAFNQFRVHYAPSPERSDVTCEFSAAELGITAPIVILLARHHQTSSPTTTLELNTHTDVLPCRYLAPFLPFAALWGQECSFQGCLSGVGQTASGWQGEGAFNLSNVDLQQLIGDRWSHHLSGQCDVQCKHLRVEKGQVTEVRGSVDVTEGRMSASLLHAAQQELRVQGQLRAQYGAEDLIDFQQFHVDLTLDEAGVVLRGRPHGGYEDVLMVDDSGTVLLREPHAHDQPLPAMHLVRLVDPSVNFLINASTRTIELLRFLPIPGGSADP